MLDKTYDAIPDELKETILAWIGRRIRPASGLLYRLSSYNLKHMFSSDTGLYISNEQFKAVMIQAGFRRYNGFFQSKVNDHYYIRVLKTRRKHVRRLT